MSDTRSVWAAAIKLARHQAQSSVAETPRLTCRALCATAYPRALGDYVSRSFDTWIWPLLGLIRLPWTTLLYLLVAAPAGGITFWGWLFVILGLMMDVASHANSYASRNQGEMYYRRA